MKKLQIAFILIFSTISSFAQLPGLVEKEVKINKFIDGTLSLPAGTNTDKLAILISGSGPTDRNGNQPMMKNDAMKKLAHKLAENGIASYRFDKRIFKMNKLEIREEDLSLDDFVIDVRNILEHFREKEKFENIILLGHSQGSLIGILAAENNADAFISIAGAGQPIDNIIVDQIGKMAPPLAENARTAFDEIRQNGITQNYSPMLESMFKPSIQPFMSSWMKYDPSKEISKLDIPVLIINGTRDIQVDVSEAELLKKASENASLFILEDMNHIFRKIDSEDRLVNTKSYNEPNQPLHPDLVPAIVKFIQEIE